ncbi:hypothetical protein ABIA30_004487 [Mycobacterium sp. MAA66]|uniref:hypothetical protein n=1 Tax=Mycobacterium sp. MAA66 TaxID=3156297 RepID=UPI003517AE6D
MTGGSALNGGILVKHIAHRITSFPANTKQFRRGVAIAEGQSIMQSRCAQLDPPSPQTPILDRCRESFAGQRSDSTKFRALTAIITPSSGEATARTSRRTIAWATEEGVAG